VQDEKGIPRWECQLDVTVDEHVAKRKKWHTTPSLIELARFAAPTKGGSVAIEFAKPPYVRVVTFEDMAHLDLTSMRGILGVVVGPGGRRRTSLMAALVLTEEQQGRITDAHCAIHNALGTLDILIAAASDTIRMLAEPAGAASVYRTRTDALAFITGIIYDKLEAADAVIDPDCGFRAHRKHAEQHIATPATTTD
jgi:hypothetical protein